VFVGADVAFDPGIGGSMKRRIAALSCCLLLVQVCAVAGEERSAPITAAVTNAAPQTGSIRASLNNVTHIMPRVEAGWTDRPTRNGRRDRGSWIERHPVWAGALVGFTAGFVIAYAATHDNKDEFITVMDPAAGAFFWGGVTSGVGALIGWSIGRNRDDGYSDNGGSGSTGADNSDLAQEDLP
jgi:hypothetical protein